MEINPRTGQVTLPDGFVFDATLTRTVFESKGLHDPAKVRNHGTPWSYFPFVAEQIEEHPLELTLCFYRDVLVSFSFQIDLYSPGAKSWDDFSLDVEEKMQEFHGQLMQRWFGRPHKIERVRSMGAQYPALRQMLNYNFPWGTAWCGTDERGGTTEAGVRYSQNDAWARADYERCSQT